MDPLHPLVPIQPAPLESPAYNRVERVQREQWRQQQREQAPEDDSRRKDAEDESEAELEDGYDPDWGAWKTVEPASQPEPQPGPPLAWEADVHQDRRAASDAGAPDDEHGGPHIDIRA